MPTYEYHCEKCRKDFDLFQSMKDDALTTCPREQCRQKTWGRGKVVRQLGTGAGLIFKGSGFYSTDYRSANYTESAKKENASATPAPAPAAATATATSETKKPAAEKPKPAPSKE